MSVAFFEKTLLISEQLRPDDWSNIPVCIRNAFSSLIADLSTVQKQNLTAMEVVFDQKSKFDVSIGQLDSFFRKTEEMVRTKTQRIEKDLANLTSELRTDFNNKVEDAILKLKITSRNFEEFRLDSNQRIKALEDFDVTQFVEKSCNGVSNELKYLMGQVGTKTQEQFQELQAKLEATIKRELLLLVQNDIDDSRIRFVANSVLEKFVKNTLTSSYYDQVIVESLGRTDLKENPIVKHSTMLMTKELDDLINRYKVASLPRIVGQFNDVQLTQKAQEEQMKQLPEMEKLIQRHKAETDRVVALLRKDFETRQIDMAGIMVDIESIEKKIKESQKLSESSLNEAFIKLVKIQESAKPAMRQETKTIFLNCISQFSEEFKGIHRKISHLTDYTLNSSSKLQEKMESVSNQVNEHSALITLKGGKKAVSPSKKKSEGAGGNEQREGRTRKNNKEEATPKEDKNAKRNNEESFSGKNRGGDRSVSNDVKEAGNLEEIKVGVATKEIKEDMNKSFVVSDFMRGFLDAMRGGAEFEGKYGQLIKEENLVLEEKSPGRPKRKKSRQETLTESLEEELEEVEDERESQSLFSKENESDGKGGLNENGRHAGPNTRNSLDLGQSENNQKGEKAKEEKESNGKKKRETKKNTKKSSKASDADLEAANWRDFGVSEEGHIVISQKKEETKKDKIPQAIQANQGPKLASRESQRMETVSQLNSNSEKTEYKWAQQNESISEKGNEERRRLSQGSSKEELIHAKNKKEESQNRSKQGNGRPKTEETQQRQYPSSEQTRKGNGSSGTSTKDQIKGKDSPQKTRSVSGQHQEDSNHIQAQSSKNTQTKPQPNPNKVKGEGSLSDAKNKPNLSSISLNDNSRGVSKTQNDSRMATQTQFLAEEEKRVVTLQSLAQDHVERITQNSKKVTFENQKPIIKGPSNTTGSSPSNTGENQRPISNAALPAIKTTTFPPPSVSHQPTGNYTVAALSVSNARTASRKPVTPELEQREARTPKQTAPEAIKKTETKATRRPSNSFTVPPIQKMTPGQIIKNNNAQFEVTFEKIP